MTRKKPLIVYIVFILLLVLAWGVNITAKSDARKQLDLMNSASYYIKDKAFVSAVPLLEEAAGYDAKYTIQAETELKNVYKELFDTSGYTRRYEELLDKQMNRKKVSTDVYLEAASYYLDNEEYSKAFKIMKNGIEKNNDEDIIQLYEDTRYMYKGNRYSYQNVSLIYNGTITVEEDGLWGIATSKGVIVIPCMYEKISSFSNGCAIVQKGKETYSVDDTNNRTSLYHGVATDISNLAQDRIWINGDDGWRLASLELVTGSNTFEDVGMFSDGASPVKYNGKWGLVDTSGGSWILEPNYDNIIRDELGKGYEQDAVFVVNKNKVSLLVDGKQKGDTYDDARPFTSDGWAAVKKDGKWGFIDVEGELRIDYQFEDALSFSNGLAPVKDGVTWGYINTKGKMVIDPIFMKAKNFENGTAPVKTADGWQFITLLEYEEEVGLL